MPDKQRTYGQFETPADVADLLLAFCLRRPGDHLLDPGCGSGAFLARAAQAQAWLEPEKGAAGALWGIELDPAAAAQAQAALPTAHITAGNFFAMAPERHFDAIVGNPPYTRAEWIGHLEAGEPTGRQLPIFDDAAGEPSAGPDDRNGERYSVGPDFLSRRAGLHAHFFVHSTAFLREGGRFGFVVPNSWLDVAYGERLKQFLLDHYQILAVIESNVERWFTQARVNTCLVVLEKCGEAVARSANPVRLARLRRPLAELIPYDPADSRRWHHLQGLAASLLPGQDVDGETLTIRVVAQGDLPAGERWGMALRAPAVYRRHARSQALPPLSYWAGVQRGYTTGANTFFYLDGPTIARWGIEAEFCRPLLKSLRHVARRRVTLADCDQQVLWLPPGTDLRGTAAAAYLAWGEAQGWHLRRTCAARRPWYSLPEQKAAPLLLAKGIWERHFAPLVEGDVYVDQQLYQVWLADGVPLLAAAALLNSSWFALQMELHGRVNFGEGVLWLAGYELEALRLPDPRYLPAGQLETLAGLFELLLGQPVAGVREALAQPVQRALDAAVFAMLGFSAGEAAALTEALLERVETRLARARFAANRRPAGG